MGHGLPNMVGMKPGELDQRMQALLPGYTTMGQDGMVMGRHGQSHAGAARRHPDEKQVRAFGDYLTAGGMFTFVRVRDHLTNYADPGWYQYPPGTVASKARVEELERDGIDVQASTA